MPAQDWIDRLRLLPHPEGGAYAETWRDEHSSAIYYLLRSGEESAWHRVADRSEVWHHYAGASLRLEVSVDGETISSHLLGHEVAKDEQPQAIVPAGAWQSATSLGDWTLVGCTVSPPFTFDAFELAPTGWVPGAFGPLISAAWLAEHRSEVALIDVRYYPDGRPGRPAYEQAHLPGAVWIDLEAGLADPPSPGSGRHPLPSPERFAATLAAAGIDDATPVVAYDDNGGMAAGRLVWLLRSLGHPAALLDGGMAAWNGPVESGWVDAAPATFTSQPWPAERFATLDQLTDAPVLLDARPPERYRGEVEPLDPRAGHIPAAHNAPWQANLGADGRFLPAAALRERLAFAADPDAVVYCGSGVTACHTLLALEVAGLAKARLYPGSWSQWCSDPGRPAETGERSG